MTLEFLAILNFKSENMQEKLLLIIVQVVQGFFIFFLIYFNSSSTFKATFSECEHITFLL